MKTIISALSILTLSIIGAPAFADSNPAADAAAAAKVARAKAKVKASSNKQDRTDTVVDKDGNGCGADVNIGNIVSEKSITGHVENEVVITGDVIAIGGGCK